MAENASAIVDEQSRLTYLTRHYYELQNVRIAPFWVACLFAFYLFNNGSANCDCLRWGFLWPVIGLLAFTAVWYWLAGRYYRQRFGWLAETPRSVPKLEAWLLLLTWIGLFYKIPTRAHAWFPYLLALLVSKPVFDAGNLRVRRIYYGAGGGLIVASGLVSWVAHLGMGAIVWTVCLVELGLGVADHLLVMSLRAPEREYVDG